MQRPVRTLAAALACFVLTAQPAQSATAAQQTRYELLVNCTAVIGVGAEQMQRGRPAEARDATTTVTELAQRAMAAGAPLGKNRTQAQADIMQVFNRISASYEAQSPGAPTRSASYRSDVDYCAARIPR